MQRFHRRIAILLLAIGVVTGCGFHLQGAQQFAFQTIAVRPEPGSATMANEIRAMLGDRLRPLGSATAPSNAEVVLDVLQEQRDKHVVAVGASGQVREFQLRLRLRFRLSTPSGKELIADTDITQVRDISFNESAVLAKEAEEAQLYRSMQSDIVRQLMRQLAAVRSL